MSIWQKFRLAQTQLRRIVTARIERYCKHVQTKTQSLYTGTDILTYLPWVYPWGGKSLHEAEASIGIDSISCSLIQTNTRKGMGRAETGRTWTTETHWIFQKCFHWPDRSIGEMQHVYIYVGVFVPCLSLHMCRLKTVCVLRISVWFFLPVSVCERVCVARSDRPLQWLAVKAVLTGEHVACSYSEPSAQWCTREQAGHMMTLSGWQVSSKLEKNTILI